MKKVVSNWALQSILLLTYKALLDFLFLRVYYTVFSYMTGAAYMWNVDKFIISNIVFAFFVLINFYVSNDSERIQNVIIVMLMVICIVPMLSVYGFVNYVSVEAILYPSIFWGIMILVIGKSNINIHKSSRYRIVAIKQASIGTLGLCSLGGLICWAWAGFPILVSLSDSTAQRLALRASRMPSLLGYVFMLLGGVLFPYLFARFLDAKKYLYAVISLIVGFLLYSINGMKTWLFMYIFVIALYGLCYWQKDNIRKICISIIVVLCFLLLFCVVAYWKLGIADFLSQFGRVFCIPNGIGFRSISFFSDSSHPYLYLRESILRHFFETPYPGGSDFYLDYGANSTITSARSNNGLWGDAFRNFGIFGVIIYPFFISRILILVNRTINTKNVRFQIFVVFLMIWNSVNVSFFTWLLTGGVIVVLIVNGFFINEDKIVRKNTINKSN